MIVEDSLEEVFKPQLQKSLEFELNNKIFKRGKLLLYKIETYSNNYEVTLIFEKGNSTETFKIPYPFNYEVHSEENGDSVLFFDYRLYTLSNKNSDLENDLHKISEVYKKSKYFNSILKIICKIK